MSISGFHAAVTARRFHRRQQAAAAGGVTTVLLMPTDNDARDAGLIRAERRAATASPNRLCHPGNRRSTTESVEDSRRWARSRSNYSRLWRHADFMIGKDDYELARILRLVRDVGAMAGVTPHSPR